MISIKCPYCNVGLKIDENKIPSTIDSFKCPKCKKPIEVSLLGQYGALTKTETPTIIVKHRNANAGKITVLANSETPFQTFILNEGLLIAGRKSNASQASIAIETMDKCMSREHIRIEVKREGSGGFKHYLSDNNSKNRTLYNNNYLENDEVVVLKDNDEIIIGKTILRFNE